MDIVIIGKKSFNRNDRPYDVYCGQSWDEARAAINAAANDFVNFYQVDAEPYRPLRPDPVVAPSLHAETAPAPSNGTKKSKKNL